MNKQQNITKLAIHSSKLRAVLLPRCKCLLLDELDYSLVSTVSTGKELDALA